MKTIILDSKNIAQFYTGLPLKKLTKKAFKEVVSYHCYTGGGNKYHCFYYDWKAGEYGVKGGGYKYAFAESAESISKTQLFNIVYDHIFNGIDCNAFTYIRKAKNDNERFKVGISLNLGLFS